MFSSALRQATRSGLATRAVRRSVAPSALSRPTFVRTLVSKSNTALQGHFWRILVLTRFSTAKKYTQDHEAVVFDDSTSVGTITITDYAQSSLGDVVFVELPSVGTEVKQGGT